jgi:ankyrin repeat protein
MRRRVIYISAIALLTGCVAHDDSDSAATTSAPVNLATQPSAATRPNTGEAAEGEGVHEALKKGRTGEALALLSRNPSLLESRDRLQQTPLHVAAHRGRADAVKWLLGRGANVNAVAYNKFTPLHLAVSGEIADALIRADADVNVKDAWGNTPLQKAAENNHPAVVDAILASGHPIDLRTAVVLKKRDIVKKMHKDEPGLAKKSSDTIGLWGGATPLAVASGQGDFEIVQLLLDAGADVNEGTFMPNVGGEATALTNAVWAGDAKIVKLLLSRGAKTDVVGGKFYPTILDYAREHSSPEIVAMLAATRAKPERDTVNW